MPTEISGSTGVNKIQDNTIVNADINSSAAIAGSKLVMPTGSVLQVVQGQNTSTYSTTSSSFSDTGLSASITPSATTSKILCVVSEVGFIHGSGSSLHTYCNLVRGSTVINGTHAQGDGDSDMHYNASSQVFLDSPSTTSATTYKMQMKTSSGTAYVNWQASSGYKSTITIMEIAG